MCPTSPFPSIRTFEFEVITVDSQGQITERQIRQAECAYEVLDNDVSLALVKIPSGSFQMGALKSESWFVDNEGPQHSVEVSGFWMGKFQVTQAQWKTVASFGKVKRALEPDPSGFKGDDRPVECISWQDAIEFCARLSKKTGREYRLPSEAEWEYACRAGTTTPFHFGETITTDLANYRGMDWTYEDVTYSGSYRDGPKGVYRKETTPVGSFKVANAFGLYDMHGNVWEWCLDYWHENYGDWSMKAPTDGSAWLTGGYDSRRVLRGGDWDYFPEGCRAAARGRDYPITKNDVLSLRVVCVSGNTKKISRKNCRCLVKITKLLKSLQNNINCLKSDKQTI
ncbi:MAG: formylglycine-generating enzyme family protein [Cyanothece sp. SIO1E1]|nr:formylglycine-generating enzyme family protein [Cyanothece sp. SIO1E1]